MGATHRFEEAPPERAERSDQQRPKRIMVSATEARQGEIILGKRGRWIWIASFAVLAILLLFLGFWH